MPSNSEGIGNIPAKSQAEGQVKTCTISGVSLQAPSQEAPEDFYGNAAIDQEEEQAQERRVRWHQTTATRAPAHHPERAAAAWGTASGKQWPRGAWKKSDQ